MIQRFTLGMRDVMQLIKKQWQQKKRQQTAKTVKKAKREKPKAAKAIQTTGEYFQTARSWVDDIHVTTLVSRNRYKMAFWGMAGLSALLAFCVLVLVPIQHTELVVVHQGQNGYTWLSMTKSHEQIKPDWARTQAEITHYVMTREAYDPLLYSHQANEVDLLSSPQVQSEYQLAQASDNPHAPINVLADKGYRTVIVNDILPLDKATSDGNDPHHHHVNLAQVNYVVVDHLFGQSSTVKTPYSAVVSWEYRGIPADPEHQLMNWDGFTITKFVVQPMNQENQESNNQQAETPANNEDQ